MKLKNTLIYIFLIILSGCHSLKILESSSPEKPAWVHGIEKNYLIGQGSGFDYNEAKQNALLMVKEKIASAIAENISVESSLAYEETRKDKAYQFLEHYYTKSKSKSGNLSYIQGIALSKADDYFWEKVKENRVERVNYYIKYPFYASDLDELIRLWNESEKELTNKLNNVLDQSDDHLSVEEIQSDIDQLKYLSDFFVDHRKAEADINIEKLLGKIQNIAIFPIVDTLGYYAYNLISGGYYISTLQKPRISSNCAIINSVQHQDYFCNVKYDFNNCAVKGKNYFKIKYDYHDFQLEKIVPFDVSLAKVYIELDNSVSLDYTDKKTFQNRRYFTCHFSFESYSELPIIIDRIELTVKRCVKNNGRRTKYEYLPTLIIDNINQQYKGKGNKSISINSWMTLYKSKRYSSGTECPSLISGKVYYRSIRTGKEQICKFQDLKYYANW